MPEFLFLQQVEKQFRWLKNVPFLPQLIDEQLKIYTLFFQPAVFEKMMQVVAWFKMQKGIKTSYHRYGGLEFRFEGKEIAHLHGNGLIDILFSREIRNQLVSEALVQAHHVNHESGWVSLYLKKNTDMNEVFAVLNRAYLFHIQK
ncbi:MAG: DUF5519 family protein [Verrucomicrobia bacterium]|nr:DUF5519 family protein [Cytophagales bacterium]